MAGAADAQTFQWQDEHGRVQSSDELPPAGSFRELRVLQENTTVTPLVRRTIELINEHARESQGRLQREESRDVPGISTQDTRGVAATIGVASPANENVRDPCLLSWDPRCIEKHAADYHPRMGYAPSVLSRATVMPQSSAEP